VINVGHGQVILGYQLHKIFNFLSSKSLILFYNIVEAGDKVWAMAPMPSPPHSAVFGAVKSGAMVQT